ncbi:hypothetical protein CAEBREN_18823 [Caenorhabditis brenneri]|uniref:DNA-directed DNA polymerase n=1 Tax=Caenorhabditis brenneri TaxID=135651 RepID=G0MAK7_CAEBE|nr:hypothetical protein CAEBREN_18823 [Caenorhabditis brenneri]
MVQIAEGEQRGEQQGENVQMGGARLKVTHRRTTGGEGRFRGAVKTVSLDVDIPNVFTTTPTGPQLFGEAIVELVDQNVPSTMGNPNLRVGIKFESPEIFGALGLAFKRKDRINAEDIVECMDSMAQSNKNLLELDVPKITIHLTYIEPPAGSGKRFNIEDILELPSAKRQRDEEGGEEREEEEVNKKERYSNFMRNEVVDNCLFHALYQAEAFYDHRLDKTNKEKQNKYRRSLNKGGRRRESGLDIFQGVQNMKIAAGVTKSRNFDRMDIEHLQKTIYAGRFQIVCFVKNSTVPYYAGPFVGKDKQLYIYLADGHYCGIRSVQRLLKTTYYCSLCNTRYRDAASHYKCGLVHQPCGQEQCPTSPQDVKQSCQKCCVTFRSEACYRNHLKNGVNGGKSRCDYTKYCSKCKASYFTNKKNNDKHVCGSNFCHRCQTLKEKDHMCTMMASVKNEKNLTRKRLFFDFESRAEPETGKQVPVLFVSLRCCTMCSGDIPKDIESAKQKTCRNCGKDGRLKIIESMSEGKENVDVAKEATEYIFGDHHNGFVAVAHNASGYDGQFLLESLISSNKAAPEICLDGTKLIFMKHNNVRLLDSLKYLTMSLSAVGKTFQVDSLKGDFPVLFIKPENYKYETTTAASAAALVFRRNHLDPEKPIVLDAKPSVSINNSVMSQKYLAWIGSTENVQINISTTYGEEKVVNHRVDGFIPPCEKYREGKAIEYFGCYYHAHDCTYSAESMIGEKQARDIWEEDERRLSEIRAHVPVEVVRECKVKAELRTNKDMAAFFDSYEPIDLLRCEKALVGGRTEVFRLCMENEGKSGHYVDVVSLYPTVMKHEAFPIGQPENVEKKSLRVPLTHPSHIPFEGFLSCRVLAPPDLKLPVLAAKVNNRLMFFLCRKCAEMENQHGCEHTLQERGFSGTFTTVELKKALSLGYKITEVYHGVKYAKWVKNDASGKGGLFTAYINQMMEEKIYSSGWPSNVNTEEEKTAYCKQYFEKEHMTLNDYSRFKKNPGKRAVAKLMLNSLWGKFAQRVDRLNTKIVLDPSEFWDIFHDTRLILVDVRPVNDVLVVQFRQQEETLASLKTSAIHLAAYTTAYARLRLYRLMESVGAENIMYTDTDSIIYTVPDGSENPLEHEMGDMLGQLTNELAGSMKGFVTTGPKSYSYIDTLSDGTEKTVNKMKGITINSEVEKKITFEKMRAMVDEVLQEITPRTVLSLPQHIMRRDKDHKVYSKDIMKEFKYTFNKRRVLSDGSTLPFGYVD